MKPDLEKILKAKSILLKIANGISPVNGERIDERSFLNDPRMIRCFFFIADMLEYAEQAARRYADKTRPASFVITPEQKSRVSFPAYDIGLNDFCRLINEQTDPATSRKITGKEIANRLKEAGILGEGKDGENKNRTVINENSAKYGFHSERKTYNGVEYDKILMNAQGRAYLLEHLEEIITGKVVS